MSGRTDESRRVQDDLPVHSSTLLSSLGFTEVTFDEADNSSVSSDASAASGEGAPVSSTRIVRTKPVVAARGRRASGKRGRAARAAKSVKPRRRRESTSTISSDSDSYDADDVPCVAGDEEYTRAAAASPAVPRNRPARTRKQKCYGSDWEAGSVGSSTNSDGESTSSAPRAPPVKQARRAPAVARPPPAAAAAVPQVLPVVAALPVVAVAFCDSSPPSQGCPTLRAPAPVAATTLGSSNMDAPCSDPGIPKPTQQ